ncbi:glycosyltransferase family 2 protein [Frankia sp. CNm7]|uniref:Glycosyltransferase family 2 protein n=1 Tax=Frankia nepalensis TaxID=1836974 RepID=A0A937RHD6_9ACTN|nr:glycosyltransferase family 2 protein [Frankia nepalensis]MBL7501236.1 glycosyltransferase family 2 protein [Frankia nepalensis]MBL7512785.1 glycosyltransferase family 2 protein [Frankia nepalensis]MBL7524467.1 glycosyltransferase family 2 protein [Frankia nepalensis]MBL7626408.1 glycosyltransferase family 2 protein [Frankia nepalensis]
MGAPADARVAAVVVTHNSERHIPGLASSLPAAAEGVGAVELLVVDNASTDQTVAAVGEHAPTATVLPTGRNAGYAAGINAGVAAAGPFDAYVALNPDVRLGPGALAALVAALEVPGTGITVPRLVDERGHHQPSLRREPTVRRALGEAVLGGRRAGRVAWLGEVVHTASAYERPGTVDWATGAVMCVSAECHRRVGPWDEGFFLYSEETDFALRARDLGLACRYVPEATALHVGGEAHTSPELYALLARNRVRLYRRRHPAAAAAAFRAAVLLGESIRAARGSVTARAAVAALAGRTGHLARPAPPARAPARVPDEVRTTTTTTTGQVRP